MACVLGKPGADLVHSGVTQETCHLVVTLVIWGWVSLSQVPPLQCLVQTGWAVKGLGVGLSPDPLAGPGPTLGATVVWGPLRGSLNETGNSVKAQAAPGDVDSPCRT